MNSLVLPSLLLDPTPWTPGFEGPVPHMCHLLGEIFVAPSLSFPIGMQGIAEMAVSGEGEESARRCGHCTGHGGPWPASCTWEERLLSGGGLDWIVASFQCMSWPLVHTFVSRK